MGETTSRQAEWAVRLAQRLMMLLPTDPNPRTNYFYVARLTETPADLADLLLDEARSGYEYERETPFLDLYFESAVRDLLRGRSLLDLGCSVGGRAVRLAETLAIPRLCGVDILRQDTDVAQRFAASRGIDADFRAGRAEQLPFETASIDNIVSYDALEHVENVELTLMECRRVLVPGGHLVVVFPPFLNPFESHLLFSELPALHWFFSGEVLAKAQHRLSISKGWKPDVLPESLSGWEKMPTLNGVSRRTFARSLARTGWEVVDLRFAPLFTTGRRAQTGTLFPLLRRICRPLLRVPGIRELATDRIACVLRKPQGQTSHIAVMAASQRTNATA